MINPYEKVPPTRQKSQFPIGDILPYIAERAHQLRIGLTEGSEDQQRAQVRLMARSGMMSWRAQPRQETVNADLRFLFDAWGNTDTLPEIGTAVTRIGGFSTLAYIQKSHLIPTNFRDFSEEIATLGSLDAEGIDTFADTAWDLMAKTHPLVHGELAPFVDHLAEINLDPEDESRKALLDASAVMPYLLSSTTRQTGYLLRDLEQWPRRTEAPS